MKSRQDHGLVIDDICSRKTRQSAFMGFCGPATPTTTNHLVWYVWKFKSSLSLYSVGILAPIVERTVQVQRSS